MASSRFRIGLVTSAPEKLRDYYPTSAEPDLLPTEPPFTPDDQLLVEELRRQGYVVQPIIWGGGIDGIVQTVDALVVRSPWDYMESDDLRRLFLCWIDDLDRAGIPVENHPRVMTWLTDKRYLKDLEAVGVPIVSSRVTDAEDAATLLEMFEAWGPLVVKPCISAAGAGLVFLESSSAAEAFQADFEVRCRRQDQLVQPFVPEIRTAGEWSLVYLGGTYSHAAHKLPAAGTILAHAEQGGSLRFAEPPAPVRAVGDSIQPLLAKAFSVRHDSAGIRRPPLYLRLDIIEAASGPVLSECEGVEPELFFRARPESIGIFRALLEERLGM
jgi:glutathione synthase/RimK-type ligase-like ATP-grasp enzyme